MSPDERDAALDAVLERLPQYPASMAVKRRLRETWPSEPAPPAPRRRWRLLLPALAVAAAILIAAPLGWERLVVRPERESAARLVAEAVNDHVRVLISQQPLEVRSGGIHQVRPWFTGRVDFAPVIPFDGDADFALQGGAIGYFLDRKAAVLVYGYRQHTISLLVFRADGLRWPSRDLTRVAGTDAYAETTRGFNVLLWRQGDLGYALVSDVEAGTLRTLASRLLPAS